MTHWCNILNKDTFLTQYDIMWENLALSPVYHETLRKLPNLFQLHRYLIIKMAVRRPVFFLLLFTCETYLLFKTACKLRNIKELVHCFTLGKTVLYSLKEDGHMNM